MVASGMPAPQRFADTETGFGVERTKEFNEAYDVSRRTLTHVALVVLPPAKQCLG